MKKNIFQGRVVNLNLEKVKLPNGQTVELEIIDHPGAAAVVPMKEEDRVLLIRQYRHAAGGYILEIPAGTLRPREDPRDCALRELEEEIGMRAERLEPLVTFFTTPGFTNEVIHIFKASGLKPGAQKLDSDEVLEVLEYSLGETIRLIRQGKIRDGKTIIGLLSVWMQDGISRGG